MKFKVGDLVICINKRANPDSELVIGKTYRIVESYCRGEDWIVLKEASGNWSPYQFELAKPKEKKLFGIAKFCQKYYGVKNV